MKVALAQLNPIVGDLAGNCRKVLEAARKAAEQGAELVVTPELAVCGYPPKDLLLREGFVERCHQALGELARELNSPVGVLVGHPTGRNVPDGRIANAASLLADGEVKTTIQKSLLPNYDVFDERRYFRSAGAIGPMEFRGRKLGVHICEDAWFGDASTFYHREPDRFFDPVAELASQGADILINLSASPFEVHKSNRRRAIVRSHVQEHELPFVFVNQVGGNDDLVFDGNSFAMNAAGRIHEHCKSFDEDLRIVDLAETDNRCETPRPSRDEQLMNALVLGLRDYMSKCGFSDCVLGLSGGIDSALACYIAAKALGGKNVHGLLMPSRHSSDHSVTDSVKLAKALDVDHEIIPIGEVHQAYERTPVVGYELNSDPAGLAQQNLQARIRGALVMVRSNENGWMALATGNKSELAVGYCTLYGDMCGGFAVLSDLLKRDVYALSRYANEVEGREVIPVNIIEKAPSAELAPDQFDQDSLPPYPILDAILEGLIEDEASVETLSRIHPPETVQWVAGKLDRNEFKRRQMPPGIKLSSRAFGSGRRMPMAARFG